MAQYIYVTNAVVLNAHCLLGQFFVAFTLIFQKPNPLNLLELLHREHGQAKTKNSQQ